MKVVALFVVAVEKSSSSFSSSSEEEEKECLRRKSKSRENLVPFEVFRNNNDKKNAASGRTMSSLPFFMTRILD